MRGWEQSHIDRLTNKGLTVVAPKVPISTPFKISEDLLQERCVEWFRAEYRHLYWKLIAIPNGGKRNVITAVRMKRTGTLSGAWDLFLSIPTGTFSGMYIEMKVGKNKLTDNQLEFFKANERNYYMRVCYTLEEFQKVIREYLAN